MAGQILTGLARLFTAFLHWLGFTLGVEDILVTRKVCLQLLLFSLEKLTFNIFVQINNNLLCFGKQVHFKDVKVRIQNEQCLLIKDYSCGIYDDW